jgi:hypothetical protein
MGCAAIQLAAPAVQRGQQSRHEQQTYPRSLDENGTRPGRPVPLAAETVQGVPEGEYLEDQVEGADQRQRVAERVVELRGGSPGKSSDTLLTSELASGSTAARAMIGADAAIATQKSE